MGNRGPDAFFSPPHPAWPSARPASPTRGEDYVSFLRKQESSLFVSPEIPLTRLRFAQPASPTGGEVSCFTRLKCYEKLFYLFYSFFSKEAWFSRELPAPWDCYSMGASL